VTMSLSRQRFCAMFVAVLVMSMVFPTPPTRWPQLELISNKEEPNQAVQQQEFVGNLAVFTDDSPRGNEDRSYAYFLYELPARLITFIQFPAGLEPPLEASGGGIAIQGEKVTRAEDKRIIIRASGFRLLGHEVTATTETGSTTTRITETETTTTRTTAPFDFSISASPSTQTVSRGQSATYTVSVTLVSGLVQPVSLSIPALMQGASYSFSRSSGDPPLSSMLVVTTNDYTPSGTYSLTITGTAGGLRRSATVSLTVLAEETIIITTMMAPFDFSISASPPSQTIMPGERAAFTVTVALLSGSAQPVSLSLSGLPPASTHSFTSSVGYPTFSVGLTITTAETVTGEYSITIVAAGGGRTHSLVVTLIMSRYARRAAPASFRVDKDRPSASTSLSYITLLVKFGDVQDEPHDKAFYENLIYAGTGSSINEYYNEISYGTVSITGVVSDGWMTLSKDCMGPCHTKGFNDRASFLHGGPDGTCGPNDDGSCLNELLYHTMATFPQINFNNFQGINIEFNSDIGAYAWGHIGLMDVPVSGGKTIKRGVTFNPLDGQTPGVESHEMGHNLGWIHSTAGWETAEPGMGYDDSYSVMSGGVNYVCPALPVYVEGANCPAHPHGENKEELGWIPSDQILVPSSTELIVKLMRLETLNSGTMLIKIPISCDMVPWSKVEFGIFKEGTCTLYVETRMRYGFDSGLSEEGVVITKYTTAGSKEKNGDFKLRPVRATPWQVGETYSDGNIQITILDSGPDYFTVHLQLPGGKPQQGSNQPLIIIASVAVILGISICATYAIRKAKKKTIRSKDSS